MKPQPTRSKTERRMIRMMEKSGRKHFQILRSPETGLRQYVRPRSASVARDECP